jgi:predicted amidohydrolase YtcJ
MATAMSREDANGQPAGGWMPQQRVSFEVALDGYTRQAAYAAFAEKRFGSLIPGQRADFVLLDRDVSIAQPAELRSTQVLETWIGGKRVYMKGVKP